MARSYYLGLIAAAVAAASASAAATQPLPRHAAWRTVIRNAGGTLMTAPSSTGGVCFAVHFKDGGAMIGCPPPLPRRSIALGSMGGKHGLAIAGRTGTDVRQVVIRFRDGTSPRLRPVGGYILARFSGKHVGDVRSFTGLDRYGKTLTTKRFRASVVRNALASNLPGHPLLVNQPGLRVYGPPSSAYGPPGRVGPACPSLLSLPPHAMRVVEIAVALAMPRYEARVRLNGRDALIVAVMPARSSGYSAVAGGCSRKMWARSIVAIVRLPHVHGASLSQHTFAVGRVSKGWVLWAVIH